MSQDMDVRAGHVSRCAVGVPEASIQFRHRQFNLMTRALGATTDEARAALIGVAARTLNRARGGQLGSVFIGQVLGSLGQYRDQLARHGFTPDFDELFQVTVTIRPLVQDLPIDHELAA